jgi:hypothetical protein
MQSGVINTMATRGNLHLTWTINHGISHFVTDEVRENHENTDTTTKIVGI